MSSRLVAIVGVIYAAIAVDQLTNGNTSMAIVFAGYAFSNAGFWWLAKYDKYLTRPKP